ncbi:MAG: peptide-methionine (S)-S-oxide reductase MsrA [Arenibacterium sp.]
MTYIASAKPILLSFLIGIAVLLKCLPAAASGTQTLVVAGGCFWCVEADFEKVAGVQEVVSGFAGGSVANPTYKQVTKGGTGHLEAVEITFDPAKISRERLVHMFLRSIDPTDAGGQFCDRGESYSTAIFVSNAGEKQLAERLSKAAQSELGKKVVTRILPETPFYPAGEYHQDFYKSSSVILTRFGPRSKAAAYKRYRAACQRDEKVRALWGDAAPFAGS